MFRFNLFAYMHFEFVWFCKRRGEKVRGENKYRGCFEKTVAVEDRETNYQDDHNMHTFSSLDAQRRRRNQEHLSHHEMTVTLTMYPIMGINFTPMLVPSHCKTNSKPIITQAGTHNGLQTNPQTNSEQWTSNQFHVDVQIDFTAIANRIQTNFEQISKRCYTSLKLMQHLLQMKSNSNTNRLEIYPEPIPNISQANPKPTPLWLITMPN